VTKALAQARVRPVALPTPRLEDMKRAVVVAGVTACRWNGSGWKDLSLSQAVDRNGRSGENNTCLREDNDQYVPHIQKALAVPIT